MPYGLRSTTKAPTIQGQLRGATRSFHALKEELWTPTGCFETRSSYLVFLKALRST